jgi:hypothetical protein
MPGICSCITARITVPISCRYHCSSITRAITELRPETTASAPHFGTMYSGRCCADDLGPQTSHRDSPPVHAGGFCFMCTLRIVILRPVNRRRTAPTVRLSLSAIIVGLFPASTISRNCLSSSGSQRRSLALLALIPPTVKRWLLAEARRGLHARNHRCRPRYLQRRYARRCSDSCRCTPDGSYRMRSWRSVLDTA